MSTEDFAPTITEDDALLTPEAFAQELDRIEELFIEFEKNSVARAPALFASLIAVLILVLWTYTTVHMIQIDQGVDPSPQLNNLLIQVNTIVGALVSALIVAVLTASEPGQNPALKLSGGGDETSQRTLAYEIDSRFAYLYNNLTKNLDVDEGHLWPEVIPHGYENVVARLATLSSKVEKNSRYYPHPMQENRSQKDLRRFIIRLNAALGGAYLFVIYMYAGIWLIVSVALIAVTLVFTPAANDTLKTMAMTQIGIMIAAGYAYFRLTPPSL